MRQGKEQHSFKQLLRSTLQLVSVLSTNCCMLNTISLLSMSNRQECYRYHSERVVRWLWDDIFKRDIDISRYLSRWRAEIGGRRNICMNVLKWMEFKKCSIYKPFLAFLPVVTYTDPVSKLFLFSIICFTNSIRTTEEKDSFKGGGEEKKVVAPKKRVSFKSSPFHWLNEWMREPCKEKMKFVLERVLFPFQRIREKKIPFTSVRFYISLSPSLSINPDSWKCQHVVCSTVKGNGQFSYLFELLITVQLSKEACIKLVTKLSQRMKRGWRWRQVKCRDEYFNEPNKLRWSVQPLQVYWLLHFETGSLDELILWCKT